MAHLIGHDFAKTIAALNASVAPERISKIVDAILVEALRLSASDVHLEPTHGALEIRFRLDGVLHPVATLTKDIAVNLVARLKVLAELLTYRLDIPQEGRLAEAVLRYGVDMRVSTFPTIHGEKAAVRIFETASRVFDLDSIGMPPAVLAMVQAALRERSGAILLTGPSGSGKTSTIYACLRHLVRMGGRQIVTIEDPVEQILEGVSQAQVRPGSEFDFARGLRSLLRQDPEVIMIGEIRDPETAAIAIEAALTGHLVFSTLHASSACGVVGRLMEMGVEPYLLTSGLKAVLNQRLVRRLCTACRVQDGAGWSAPGCEQCAGAGYQGRMLLAEFLGIDHRLRALILKKSDSVTLAAHARQAGARTIWDEADDAVSRGMTSKLEIERVLGFRETGHGQAEETS